MDGYAVTYAHPRRRRLALCAAGASILTPTVFLASSTAAPAPHGHHVDTPRTLSDLLPTPRPLDALFGAGIAASSTVTHARVVINVPAVTTLVYAGTQSRPPLNNENRVFPVPAGLEPPHPKAECNYYVNAIQNDLYIATVDEAAHKFTSVGHFPPATVTLFAFGSIPVTATLQLSQSAHDGKLVPIQANTVGQGSSIRKTDPQSSFDFGCDTAWEQAVPPVTISSGEVSAVISNVQVDKVPLDVGPNCHTASPLQLRLIGEPPALGGNYNNVTEGGVLAMARDTRTTGGPVALPLYPGSKNLGVPAFTGCRDTDGQDMSPIVTSLASGPNATVAVNQSPISFSFTDLQSPSLCSIFDGSCPQLPNNVTPPEPGA